MKDAPSQLDMHENTASSRRHASRVSGSASSLELETSKTVEHEDTNSCEQLPSNVETFNLSLKESECTPQINIEGVSDKKGSGLADSLDGKTRALTVADVAELLNISERQVYKLVAEYRIPCFKIGGSIRFDPCAVAVWLR
jgi:excisionase family DNA binding protein